MAFEKPANDNFSPAELRQRRSVELQNSSAMVRGVRNWMKRRRDENELVASDQGEISNARRQEIHAALSALEIALAETENALAAAEENMDSLEAFGFAQASVYRLSLAHIEAEQVVEGE